MAIAPVSKPSISFDDFGRRNLPETTFVSLAEAVTWVAFGDAMTADQLQADVEGIRPPIIDNPQERLRKFLSNENVESEVSGIGHFQDRQSGLDKLADAWRQVREGVRAGRLTMKGRHAPNYSPYSLHGSGNLTDDLIVTYSQFDISTGGIRQQPFGHPEVIWEGDLFGLDRELQSFGGDGRFEDGYMQVEIKRDELQDNWPNPVDRPRKSHQEVIDWCKRWIASGKGNGMDKAWASFSADPDHEGLARDDVFRPAWNEAKRA
jgi:hypothetical protein